MEAYIGIGMDIEDLSYAIAGAMGKNLYFVSYDESYMAPVNFFSRMEGKYNYYGRDSTICYDMETGRFEHMGTGKRKEQRYDRGTKQSFAGGS